MWITLGEIAAAAVIVVVFFRIGAEFAPVLFRWVANWNKEINDDERNEQ